MAIGFDTTGAAKSSTTGAKTKTTTGSASATGMAGKAAKTVADATGISGLWNKFKLLIAGIFSAEAFRWLAELFITSPEGQEMLKTVKIRAFGAGDGDEIVYTKLRSLFLFDEQSILGEFEENFEESDKDFDRFRSLLAKIHNVFLLENKNNASIDIKKSPAYLVLAGVISKHREGFDAQMLFVGCSIAKDELGIKKTYEASKKPMKIILIIFAVLVGGIAFLLFGTAIIAFLVINFNGGI